MSKDDSKKSYFDDYINQGIDKDKFFIDIIEKEKQFSNQKKILYKDTPRSNKIEDSPTIFSSFGIILFTMSFLALLVYADHINPNKTSKPAHHHHINTPGVPPSTTGYSR